MKLSVANHIKDFEGITGQLEVIENYLGQEAVIKINTNNLNDFLCALMNYSFMIGNHSSVSGCNGSLFDQEEWDKLQETIKNLTIYNNPTYILVF